jgi:hypothetical protein
VGIDLNALNGKQRRILRDAIVDAFTRDDLNAALDHRDLPTLANFVADGPLNSQVERLIVHARSVGYCDQLVAMVLEERPNNTRVRRLMGELAGSVSPRASSSPEERDAQSRPTPVRRSSLRKWLIIALVVMAILWIAALALGRINFHTIDVMLR